VLLTNYCLKANIFWHFKCCHNCLPNFLTTVWCTQHSKCIRFVQICVKPELWSSTWLLVTLSIFDCRWCAHIHSHRYNGHFLSKCLIARLNFAFRMFSNVCNFSVQATSNPPWYCHLCQFPPIIRIKSTFQI